MLKLTSIMKSVARSRGHMKINHELIKKMRRELKFSQEEMAAKLFMSTRQLSRIENGQSDLDLLPFFSILGLLGYHTEDFWLIYLDTKEYEDYKQYRELKKLLNQQQFEKAHIKLQELEQSSLSKYKFMEQYFAYAKARVDPALSFDERLAMLQNAIKLSIKDFDEAKIRNYRLTFPEMLIVYEIACAYQVQGSLEEAIELTLALTEVLDDARISEEDKGNFVPVLFLNLAWFYGLAGDYQKGLKFAHQAWDAEKEYRNFRFTHLSLYNIAKCQFHLGEEEQFYQPFLLRAYHFACAIGDHTFAKEIKESAKVDFGITFDF